MFNIIIWCWSYKHVGEKLKSVTSDELNGSKKFKQDTDYLENFKHHTNHLEGVENWTSFSRSLVRS